jgi:hypothetical protein
VIPAAFVNAVPLAALVLLAACGGSGSSSSPTIPTLPTTPTTVPSRTAWIEAETHRLGHVPDADQLGRLEYAHKNVCNMDEATFAAYIGVALDHKDGAAIDLPVTYFCPNRIAELRRILPTYPDRSLSAYS